MQAPRYIVATALAMALTACGALGSAPRSSLTLLSNEDSVGPMETATPGGGDTTTEVFALESGATEAESLSEASESAVTGDVGDDRGGAVPIADVDGSNIRNFGAMPSPAATPCVPGSRPRPVVQGEGGVWPEAGVEPPSHWLNFEAGRVCGESPTAAYGTFSLANISGAATFQGIVTRIEREGTNLVLAGSGCYDVRGALGLQGDWRVGASVVRQPDGSLRGIVKSITVPGEVVAIDATRAPTFAGWLDGCENDARACFSVAQGEALLISGQQPQGQLRVSNLVRTSACATGTLSYTGFAPNAPTLAGQIRQGDFQGDAVVLSGTLEPAGRFILRGRVGGFENPSPPLWRLVPYAFEARDGKGNVLVNFDEEPIPDLAFWFPLAAECDHTQAK